MYIWIIIGVFCVIYGICIKNIGSGTSFYLIWFVAGGTSWFLAVCAYVNLWSRLPGIVHKFIIGMATIGVLLFVIVEGCIISFFGAEGEKNLDYIIVLGAQIYEWGPSPVLKHRLESAVIYLEENPDTICIVSGGQGSNEPCPEAEGMASYLIEHGISERSYFDRRPLLEYGRKHPKQCAMSGCSKGYRRYCHE